MDNKEYWKEFWKINEPSDFAKLCTKYLSLGSLIDMGCGTGRDTYFLYKYSTFVVGVDYAHIPYSILHTLKFVKKPLNTILKTSCKFDTVYSRFFLHCIKSQERIKLLKWTKKLFMAEWRDIKDKPKLFTDHGRYLVNSEEFRDITIKEGFKILHFSVGRNKANYRNENPIVGRIICERIH